ncbi:MAG: hypothetical protein GY696_20115 [Gammaproteobacteria bacterium]|nr:hypothetical protein [Gammaproteobacteria bacterium]
MAVTVQRGLLICDGQINRYATLAVFWQVLLRLSTPTINSMCQGAGNISLSAATWAGEQQVGSDGQRQASSTYLYRKRTS